MVRVDYQRAEFIDYQGRGHGNERWPPCLTADAGGLDAEVGLDHELEVGDAAALVRRQGQRLGHVL
eukprot:SAG25_NODE_459_length_7828_cov_24.263907_8_plen_66_part_00